MTDAYIRHRYPDGDMDYSPPRWKKILQDRRAKSKSLDFSQQSSKNKGIKNRALGFSQKETGAKIAINDNGAIDLFALEDLGIHIDPKTKTMTFVADHIRIASQDTHIDTEKENFFINGYNWNDQHQEMSIQEEIHGVYEYVTQKTEDGVWEETSRVVPSSREENERYVFSPEFSKRFNAGIMRRDFNENT